MGESLQLDPSPLHEVIVYYIITMSKLALYCESMQSL